MRWGWDVTGKYSAKSAYKMMYEGGVRFQCASAVWRSWATMTCKLFIWLALQYRVWTSDRRQRHGLQDHSSACFLCDQEEDKVDHILLQCVYARQVWFLCFRELGVDEALIPTTDDTLGDWWVSARKRIDKRHRRGFDTICISVCWNLWKQRNGRVFRNSNIANEWGTADLIHQELRLWASARGRGVQHGIE